MANAISERPSAVGLSNTAIYSKAQTAELLGVTVRYIERQVATGKLRACKPTGKLVRILGRDLESWLNAGASVAA